jgi:2-dehydropantoate 2-reductase
MVYAVIGSGGVGGYYAARLVSAGATVHLLARSAAAALSRDGLTLQSVDGDRHLPTGGRFVVHEDWATMPSAEVVVVAVKAAANPQVVPRLSAVAAEGGTVVLVQNGIDGEPAYAAALPGREVLGGLAFLASQRTAPTVVQHIGYGALTLAAYRPGYAPGPVGPGGQRLAADLQRAGTPAVLAEDLLAARWTKLVWNIPFNGLTVLLGARTDALVADPAARRLAAGVMAEVVEAAAADGRPLPAGTARAMLAATDAMAPYAPSMKVDYDERRPLELGAIYRAPLARAAAAGAAMPRTAALADALTFLDARNRA